MHTVKLQIADKIYSHVMFLLKNLNTNDLKIIEDTNAQKTTNIENNLDFSKYQIDAFKNIEDPLKWQNDIRDEWS